MFNIVTYLKNRFQLLNLPKKSVVVLAYHNVEDRINVGEDIYTVTTSNFIQHLSILNQFFTVITPDQLFAKNRPSSKPCILITFDDGKKNNFTQAFPILEQFGLPAVFFITPNLLGREGFMTEEDVAYVSEYHITIGSHGLTHADFGKIDIQETEAELGESRQWLEQLISREVTTFAYPYGGADNRKEEDIDILNKCGYKQAYILGGDALPEKEVPYRIPRLLVTDVLGSTFLSQIINAIKSRKST